MTFDPHRGPAYADWAFYYASMRLWEHLRRAHGDDPETLARIRAAMFRFLAYDHRFFDPCTESRADCKQMLRGFSDGLLMSSYLVVGGQPIAFRGEDDLVEAEDSLHTAHALGRLLASLTPEQRRLLTRCHAYGDPVKEAAKEAKKGYRTVLRELHDLLDLLGARLAGLGIKRLPSWSPLLSGQVLDEPTPPV